MASSRGRRRGTSRRPKVTETSVPTGRAAYTDTRKWLLRTHGPVCAYCGLTYPPRELTLDHVTPRRGQSAYDRRDNLVLACKRCNTAKADKSFLAWVLGARSRAVHLYKYGQHLSEGILELLRPMVGAEVVQAVAMDAAHGPHGKAPAGSHTAARGKSHAAAHARHVASPAKPHGGARPARHVFGPDDDGGESPYLDGPAAAKPAGPKPAGPKPAGPKPAAPTGAARGGTPAKRRRPRGGRGRRRPG